MCTCINSQYCPQSVHKYQTQAADWSKLENRIWFIVWNRNMLDSKSSQRSRIEQVIDYYTRWSFAANDELHQFCIRFVLPCKTGLRPCILKLCSLQRYDFFVIRVPVGDQSHLNCWRNRRHYIRREADLCGMIEQQT